MWENILLTYKPISGNLKEKKKAHATVSRATYFYMNPAGYFINCIISCFNGVNFVPASYIFNKKGELLTG